MNRSSLPIHLFAALVIAIVTIPCAVALVHKNAREQGYSRGFKDGKFMPYLEDAGPDEVVIKGLKFLIAEKPVVPPIESADEGYARGVNDALDEITLVDWVMFPLVDRSGSVHTWDDVIVIVRQRLGVLEPNDLEWQP